MKEDDKEYIRRLFAELTGVLEDASAMALIGSSQQLTSEAAARIIQSLEQAMADTDNLLDNIKHRSRQ